jgi:hypothetical protein
MLRDYPGIEVLEMVDAPGTNNDIANLAIGRRIRAVGIRTHVPNGGSVRSGAVELFLAGETRTIDDGARFAVHSWLDNYGREPGDFAPDAPENRLYLDYYVEMGMSESRAREFYAMTNSVPHASALWLRADDMRLWIQPERVPASRSLEWVERQPVMMVPAIAMLSLDTTDLLSADLTLGHIEVEQGPVIAYGDLQQLLLARLDLSQLDSQRAFP